MRPGFRPRACPWVRPKAWFIPAQGNALGSSGFVFCLAGQRPASDGRPFLEIRMSWIMNCDFSARISLRTHEPRALPWAGMNDAFGVVIAALPQDCGRAFAEI